MRRVNLREERLGEVFGGERRGIDAENFEVWANCRNLCCYSIDFGSRIDDIELVKDEVSENKTSCLTARIVLTDYKSIFQNPDLIPLRKPSAF
jgi:hypothetical protein